MWFKNFSRKQWCILFIYSAVNMLGALCASVPVSFYPIVAGRKGATPADFGLVGGVFGLSLFCASLFYGKIIPLYGTMFVCLTGVFMTGTSSILFGFLHKVNDVNNFVALSVAIRLIEGVGVAAVRSSSLCVLLNEFCNEIEIAFAIFQSFMTAGLIIGPTAGGALYELGGFMLPFLLIGFLHLCGFAAIVCIPKNYLKKEHTMISSNVSYYTLLRNPTIILSLLVAFGVYINVSAILTLLEPHVKSLNLTTTEIGLLFVGNALALCVTSHSWGRLCESYIMPQYVWCIGAGLIIVALMLLGPAPYLHLNLNLYTCGAALIIHGIGESAEIVASFSAMNKAIVSAGISNDVIAHGLMTTLFISSLALAGFVGPTVGGILFESIGFPWGLHVNISYHLVLAFCTIIYTTVSNRNNKSLIGMKTFRDPHEKSSYESFE